MAIYKGNRKKIYVCLLFLLAAVVLGACGDDTDVTVPAVKYQDAREILGAEKLETEESGATDATEVQAEDSQEGNSEDKENAADNNSDTKQGTGVQEGTGETDEAEPETISITISAAGDTSLGNHQAQDYYFSFRQAYDKEGKDYFFENVYDIFSQDDMTIVNLEGTLTFSENMQPDRTYNIKGDPEYVEILTSGSVEAVSMANNHRYDYGEEGSRDTVNAVTGAGIKYAFDENLGIYETKGIRIGFVSVSEASRGSAVEKTLEEGIALLKEEGVDLILACCHWGTEREYYPEDYQRTLGKKCIDWGADLVIGHHPHVLQGIEEYQGKYIVYSLGNFCFGANRNPADKDTMIFQQTFTFVDGEKQEDGEIRVIPCSVSSVTDRNDFRPTPAEGEEAERIIGRINEFSKDFGVSFTADGYLEEK